MYCNRPCLCLFVGLFCLRVCYHDISKLRASIFTKLGLSVGEGSDYLQLIKFWPSCAPGKEVCGGAKFFGSTLLQPARSVCVASERFFIYYNLVFWFNFILGVQYTRLSILSGDDLIYTSFSVSLH